MTFEAISSEGPFQRGQARALFLLSNWQRSGFASPEDCQHYYVATVECDLMAAIGLCDTTTDEQIRVFCQQHVDFLEGMLSYLF